MGRLPIVVSRVPKLHWLLEMFLGLRTTGVGDRDGPSEQALDGRFDDWFEGPTLAIWKLMTELLSSLS